MASSESKESLFYPLPPRVTSLLHFYECPPEEPSPRPSEVLFSDLQWLEVLPTTEDLWAEGVRRAWDYPTGRPSPSYGVGAGKSSGHMFISNVVVSTPTVDRIPRVGSTVGFYGTTLRLAGITLCPDEGRSGEVTGEVLPRGTRGRVLPDTLWRVPRRGGLCVPPSLSPKRVLTPNLQ